MTGPLSPAAQLRPCFNKKKHAQPRCTFSRPPPGGCRNRTVPRESPIGFSCCFGKKSPGSVSVLRHRTFFPAKSQRATGIRRHNFVVLQVKSRRRSCPRRDAEHSFLPKCKRSPGFCSDYDSSNISLRSVFRSAAAQFVGFSPSTADRGTCIL